MKPAPLKNSAVGLLAVLGCVACEVPEFKPLEVGDPAPGFAATTLDGAPVTGDDLLGAPYMLNIWATWCAPCRKEMPELQELHDAYAGQGFRVVGVSVDDKGSADLIGEFTEELQIGFPIFHDPSWEIVDAYFLLGLPGTLPGRRRGDGRPEMDGSLPADGRRCSARRAGAARRRGTGPAVGASLVTCDV